MGLNYRWNRLYRNARRQIDAGRLGEVVAVRTVFSIAGRALPAWKRSRADGGGALNELGSHHVDLVRYLFGEIAQVKADIQSRHSEADTAFVQMQLESGLVVQSLFAFGIADEERFEIHGREGTLIVDRSRHQDVRFERPGRRWRRLRRAAHALAQVVHAPYVLEKRFVPGHEPSHRIALGRFVAAVAGDERSVEPDLDDGYACVAVIDAAERSARERRAVTPETGGRDMPDVETRRG
jgi:myo-inositol 2-dehydrogenase / D-chiro-inositol 1-dehydrogenase